MKSSNEELLSMNEELQSANEELETSKEEIQAANEALARSNSDLENLLTSTRIATVFLDDELRIDRFTPAMTAVYNLLPADVGRPLSDITHRAGACRRCRSANLRDWHAVDAKCAPPTAGGSFAASFLPHTRRQTREWWSRSPT